MNKIIAALASALFLTSAAAGEITLYGLVDLGLNWTQTKSSGHSDNSHNSSTKRMEVASGQNCGSRFGIKGIEDLGNGLKVGFLLENGFKADTGLLENSDRLFNREVLLFVQSNYGELSFGRTGGLDSGTGRYFFMGIQATPLGLGWSNIGNSFHILQGTGDRMDNTITYKSPTIGGITAFAQTSLKKDVAAKDMDGQLDAVEGDEGSSDADRYYALGIKYGNKTINAGVVASYTDYSSFSTEGNNDKGAYVFGGYVNYDFGWIKPMLAAQYWDGGLQRNQHNSSFRGALTKGYGLVAGGVAPLWDGVIKVTCGWNDYESIDRTESRFDGNNLMVAIGYEYPFSKRTLAYIGIGYKDVDKQLSNYSTKDKTTQTMLGLLHRF